MMRCKEGAANKVKIEPCAPRPKDNRSIHDAHSMKRSAAAAVFKVNQNQHVSVLSQTEPNLSQDKNSAIFWKK
jgi:hypothetical protein